MSSVPDVILLRRERPPDRYVKAFADVDMTATCVPTLTFRFPHDNALRQCLANPDAYDALVATSPRAVAAVKRVFESDAALHDTWRGRRAFAVGPATATAWCGLGLTPVGQTSGSADALVDAIATSDLQKPLLFLSGNRRRDVLPNGLQAHGIAFHEQEAYVTCTRSDLEMPGPGTPPRWLAFFSPSGLDAVQQSGVDLGAYRIAAIGPTTGTALSDAGASVEAIASTPSPGGLVGAIQAADTR